MLLPARDTRELKLRFKWGLIMAALLPSLLMACSYDQNVYRNALAPLSMVNWRSFFRLICGSACSFLIMATLPRSIYFMELFFSNAPTLFNTP
jgi:hypothetical protein